jgi:hypothetical protein
LTAYLLNVKVFVWFNPIILVIGTHPLPKGVEPRGICVLFFFSPHEIGKSEELRESELPCVGRRFGVRKKVSRKDRKLDEDFVSGGRRARRRWRPILFWKPSTCRQDPWASIHGTDLCRP